MQRTILEINEESLLKRLILGRFSVELLYGMPFFLIYLKTDFFTMIDLTWYVPFLLLISSMHLPEYKHYTYKIELDGKLLKMKTHLWCKKKDLVLDLTNVTIYYSKYGYARTIKSMILFYDGINTPLWKTGKILHRINPDSSFYLNYWKQTKVKELYDKLEEIQKEVLENEAIKSGEAK